MVTAFCSVLWQSRVTQQRPFCCSIDRWYITKADFADKPDRLSLSIETSCLQQITSKVLVVAGAQMAKAVPADATVSVSQNLQGSAAQLLDEHARRIAAEFQLNTDQVAVLAHCSRWASADMV